MAGHTQYRLRGCPDVPQASVGELCQPAGFPRAVVLQNRQQAGLSFNPSTLLPFAWVWS